MQIDLESKVYIQSIQQNKKNKKDWSAFVKFQPQPAEIGC